MDTKKISFVMKGAAFQAGEALLAMQPQTRRLASRKDFLTDADLRADEIISSTLAEYFPDVYYSSEEKENDDPTKGLRWVVDPLDSTVNFFLGDDNWAVSIALVEDGNTKAAVLYMPAKEKIFEAVEGGPASYQSYGSSERLQSIHVNEEDTLENSQFWAEWCKDVPGGKDTQRVLEVVEKLRRHSIYPQIRNCAAGDPMAVATGQISGFVMTKPDPFDVAAAGLIVKQAGGTVTDLEGRAWNALSKSFVATNGKVHNALLELLNS